MYQSQSRSQSLRMSATLRLLLLFTLLVSCLSAPKFHLVETEDEGEGGEGGVDEVGSGQEDDEGEEGGADQLGANPEDGDYKCTGIYCKCSQFDPLCIITGPRN